jgi:hypothetical protein
LSEALATNVVAFAAFWVVLAVVNAAGRSLALDWPILHAVQIAANLAGVGVAWRLRGRVTSIVLGVTAGAQIAEYAMHLLFGIQTVQGGPTQWAVLLAGLLGTGLGALMLRTRRQDSLGTQVIASRNVEVQPERANPSVSEPLSLIVLRPRVV